jgi:hypothetical protein
MMIDSFAYAINISYFLLCMFIAYLMLQFGNLEDRSQDMFFRVLMGQALKINSKKTPTARATSASLSPHFTS